MKYQDPVTGEIKTVAVKAADSLPIGTIVEYEGAEIPKGYELVEETVYNPEVYSTDEVLIGTWFGKNLYRKTYSVGELPNTGGSKSIPSGLTNVNVVDMYGYAVRPTDDMHIMLPYAVANYNIGMLYNNANNIMVLSQADMTAYKESYITIEYTKNQEVS